MIIFYKQYKNSRISTFLDFIGAGFQMISIVLAAYQILEVVQSVGGDTGIVVSDLLGVIAVCAIFFLSGKGVRTGARKIAENKAKKN